MDENIRESFHKVKQDISFLRQEVNALRSNLIETRQRMIEMSEIMGRIHQEMTSTHEPQSKTPSTHPSTHDYDFKPPKPLNLPISTGNQGVPTDRQTDRQTHQQTHKNPEKTQDPIENVAEMLDSLDSLKKELRLKFKRLTDQELLVFSTIYQLDEEQGYTDHKSLSKRLNLSESSIRDYVGRLIKKGIPVEKKKINNKSIQLSISNNLKKIASLSTILQLRDL